jgi:hypothetical protein
MILMRDNKLRIIIMIVFLISLSTNSLAMLSPHISKMPVTNVIVEVANWYYEEFGYNYKEAKQIMIEIGNQESWLGTYPTTYDPGGDTGFAQFNPGITSAFYHVKQKLERKPERIIKIQEKWGFNPLTIELSELDHSDIKSAVFLREFLLSDPNPIPSTIEGRANWWKEKYNTASGAGTIIQYIDTNTKIVDGYTWIYYGTSSKGELYFRKDDDSILAYANLEGDMCVFSGRTNIARNCLDEIEIYSPDNKIVKIDSTDDLLDIYVEYYDDGKVAKLSNSISEIIMLYDSFDEITGEVLQIDGVYIPSDYNFGLTTDRYEDLSGYFSLEYNPTNYLKKSSEGSSETEYEYGSLIVTNPKDNIIYFKKEGDINIMEAADANIDVKRDGDIITICSTTGDYDSGCDVITLYFNENHYIEKDDDWIYEYDEYDNLIKQTSSHIDFEGAPLIFEYEYYNDNLLKKTIYPGGELVETSYYDPFGRRIKLDISSSTTISTPTGAVVATDPLITKSYYFVFGSDYAYDSSDIFSMYSNSSSSLKSLVEDAKAVDIELEKCKEYDSSDELYKDSFAIYKGDIYHDYCITSNKLNEYYCSGGMLNSKEIICKDGCLGYACYKADTLSVINIATWTQLNATRNNMGASYKLIANLSSLDSDYSGIGDSWMPIGDMWDNSFSGRFDGQNNTISDLIIDLPGSDHVGLFGYSTGHISNLGLIDAKVIGGFYDSGILIGQGRGVVSNSFSTGSVSCVNEEGCLTGGLIGMWFGGPITNCYSTANVTSFGAAGGLIGDIEPGSGIVISNSYSTGNVAGVNMVGGLIGYFGGGIISNSYSTGNVSGNDDVGGFLGYNGGVITNCFWDNETSGQEVGVGGEGASQEGVTGKTIVDMRNINTFIRGSWDISMSTTDLNKGYPYLAWQGVEEGHTWLIYDEESHGYAHSLDGKKLILNHIGTPPFKINIRKDRNFDLVGGYAFIVTSNYKSELDLFYANNPSGKYYYQIKDADDNKIEGDFSVS